MGACPLQFIDSLRWLLAHFQEGWGSKLSNGLGIPFAPTPFSNEALFGNCSLDIASNNEIVVSLYGN